MLHENFPSPTARTVSRATRSAGSRLIEALAATVGSGRLMAHRETAWASITFAGTRHTMTWQFRGAAGIADGEALIATLPDHEFRIARHLVADATVVDVAQRIDPEEMLVTAEILLLQED